MIFVYGDESMDETKQRVCSVAAVFGTGSQWKELEAKWVERNGGVHFHATDCDSDLGDYKNREHLENKVLYRDMVTMLSESGLRGVGVAIDLVAAKIAFPVDQSMAYYRAFWQLIDTVESFVSDSREIAELTFDNRTETNHNVAFLYATLRHEYPEWKETLASKISFESSGKNPRIQVGDLLARETMKHLDNLVGPVERPTRKSWKALCDTGRFFIIAYSTEWFAGMKEQKAALAPQLLNSAHEYHLWLQQTGRQDNPSNVLMFARLKNHNFS
jgi:hypothetical protein